MKKISFLIVTLFCVFFLAGSANALVISYGIVKTTDHSRPSPGSQIAQTIEENGGVYIGNDEKIVYLTFDCGYENGYTGSILDTLKNNDVEAMFFITGHYLTSATDLVKRMAHEGHIVANHTYSHKNLSKISYQEMMEDINKLENKYESLIGEKLSHYIRPPEGVISDNAMAYLDSKGYKNIFWSLAYVDWHKDESKGKEYAYDQVMSRIHNGAIVLMHTVSKDNSLALNDIIVSLKEQGYQFGRISDLI